MRVFLDTSALAKRYVAEPGTDIVARQCQAAEEIILSSLCVPELISGLNRLKRSGELSTIRYRMLKRRLAADVEEATVMDLAPAIISRAISCLERAPLRASDAIHLACALESMCDLFLTADRRQASAATRFNLKVEPVADSH